MTWIKDRWALSYLGGQRRLTRAAGISTVIVVCHPKMWAEVQGLARQLIDVRPDPGSARTREDGLAEVTLSGTGLAADMHAMRTVWAFLIAPFTHRFDPPSRAVARRVYLAMARTVEQVSSEHSDGSTPQIVIDDRLPDGGAS